MKMEFRLMPKDTTEKPIRLRVASETGKATVRYRGRTYQYQTLVHGSVRGAFAAVYREQTPEDLVELPDDAEVIAEDAK